MLYQLSIINYQLSTINYQLSTINMSLIEYLYQDDKRINSYLEQVSSGITYDKVSVLKAIIGFPYSSVGFPVLFVLC